MFSVNDKTSKHPMDTNFNWRILIILKLSIENVFGKRFKMIVFLCCHVLSPDMKILLASIWNMNEGRAVSGTYSIVVVGSGTRRVVVK